MSDSLENSSNEQEGNEVRQAGEAALQAGNTTMVDEHGVMQIPDNTTWAFRQFTIVLAAIIGFIAITGNGLTLVAAAKCSRVLCVKKYALIISLAVADFGVGLDSLVYIFGVLNASCMSVITNIVLDIPMHSMVASSMLHLFALACERFTAILYPLHYETLVTARRIKYTIVFCWLTSIVFGVSFFAWIPSTDGEYCHTQDQVTPVLFKTGTMFGLYLLVGLAFMLLYLKILLIVREQASRLAPVVENTKEAGLEGNLRICQGSKIKVSSNKGTRLVLVIMITYLVSWGPYFVAKMVHVKHLGASYANTVSFTLELGLMSSCINAFVYAYMNSDFRNAYKEVLCCGC